MRNEDDNTVRPSGSDIRAALHSAWAQSVHTVSMFVIWSATVLFVSVAVLDVLGVVSRNTVVSFLALSRSGILQHHLLYQFLTAPLLHPSVTHLLFNMLALWMLGPAVERAMGRRRYILFSVACALSSMLGFLLLSPDPRQLVMGYSGVVFGILVAQALYFPNSWLMFFLFFPMKMKHAVLILGAVELYLTVLPERAGIAHSAHLFGALAAFAYVKYVQQQDGGSRARGRRAPMEGHARRSRPKKRPRMPKEL